MKTKFLKIIIGVSFILFALFIVTSTIIANPPIKPMEPIDFKPVYGDGVICCQLGLTGCAPYKCN